MFMKAHDLSKVQHVRRRVVILSIVLVGLGLLLFKPVDSGDSFYHFWLEATGGLLILLAIGIRLWCTLYIGGRKNARLVTYGPYSLCRNPLYVGSFLGAVGVGLQTGMMTFGAICGVLCLVIFSTVVHYEEVFLAGRFGRSYKAYVEWTPRFWPRFSRYDAGADYLEFNPASLWRALRDGLVFCVVFPLSEIIEELHEAGNLPAVLSLF